MFSCPCGGFLKFTTHTVKSTPTITLWLNDETKSAPNGIIVEQDVCGACGRIHVKVLDKTTRGIICERG